MVTESWSSPGSYSWTVPDGVETITIRCLGAGSIHQNGSDTQSGGESQATFSVTPGETLYPYVGGENNAENGGFNGGGDGGDETSNYLNERSGGGGASDVRRSGETLSDRIIVAGGAGGFADYAPFNGGVGGGANSNGAKGVSGDNGEGGDGGTQSNGGNGGYSMGGNRGDSGSLGVGGKGGEGSANAGGGGGGGYYGGGGGTGGSNYSNSGGGGGGSGWVASSGTDVSGADGVNTGDGYVEISYTTPPNSPTNISATVDSNDQLTLAWNSPTDWGGEEDNYYIQMNRDGTSWEEPAGGPVSPTHIHNYFGEVGGWRTGDMEDLGAIDGFNDVRKADATANDSYEDIFTGQFTTANFDGSGAGNYVYMAFAAKWNERPDSFGGGPSNNSGEAIVNPEPDPNKYQLYVLRSDGQNDRNEYFRIFYNNSNTTAVGYIADPYVWTGWDSWSTNATIVGSESNRTVTPHIETYGPSNGSSYGRQVGIDSSFQFRISAQNSAGASSWSQSSTVYTDPIPPHNPSVGRPDADTIQIKGEVQSDHSAKLHIQYREDTGSGYDSWSDFDHVTDDNHPHLISGSIENKGSSFTLEYLVGEDQTGVSGSLQENARYQFRLRTWNHVIWGDAGKSEWVYADYDNGKNIYFEDDFESGDLSKWDSVSGASANQDDNSNWMGLNGADAGNYSLRLTGDSYVTKNLGDLTGESDVIVRAAAANGNADDATEFGKIQWYDGNTWQNVYEMGWVYNRQGWHEAHVKIPSSYLSTDNRLRLRGFTSSDGNSETGFDRVIVSDIRHESTAYINDVKLSFTDRANNKNGYRILRSADGGSTWENWSGDINPGAEGDTFTFTDEDIRQEYHYKVQIWTDHTTSETPIDFVPLAGSDPDYRGDSIFADEYGVVFTE